MQDQPSRSQSLTQPQNDLPTGIHRVFEIGVWLFAGAAVFLMFYWSQKRFFNPDEFEAVHTAWKIQQGGRIYVDFFQHHHPFFYYLIIPMLKVFGESAETLIACRLMPLTFSFGTLVVTFLLGRILFNRLVAAVSVLLLATTFLFVRLGMEIRPDTPMVFLMLLSLYWFFGNQGRPRRLLLLASGVSLGVAFLIFQKALIPGAICFAVLIYRVFRKEMRAVDVLWFVVPGIVVVAPYAIYLFASGTFQEYWFFNWILNANALDSFSAKKCFQAWYSGSPGILLMACMGIVLTFRESSKRQLSLITMALAASILFVRGPNPQYALPALPLVAILAAGGLQCIGSRRVVLQIVILVFASGIPFHFMYVNATSEQAGVRQKNQLQLVSRVLELTSPDDKVYDGNNRFNLFRPDIHFYWFSVGDTFMLETHRMFRPVEYDVLSLIDEHKPKVVSVHEIPDLKDPRLTRHYRSLQPFGGIGVRID